MLEMTGNNESLTFQIVTFTEMQEAREREVKDLEDLFNSGYLEVTQLTNRFNSIQAELEKLYL